MPLSVVLTLVWLHFLADWLMQTDRVATQKSQSNSILLWHVSVYSLPFVWFGWQYALTNGALHFVVDWFTCRATTRLHRAQKRHWFFVVIGLDQALHFTALFWTWCWLYT